MHMDLVGSRVIQDIQDILPSLPLLLSSTLLSSALRTLSPHPLPSLPRRLSSRVLSFAPQLLSCSLPCLPFPPLLPYLEGRVVITSILILVYTFFVLNKDEHVLKCVSVLSLLSLLSPT